MNHFDGAHTFGYVDSDGIKNPTKRTQEDCGAPKRSPVGPAPCAAPEQRAQMNRTAFLSKRWEWNDDDKRAELSDPECRLLVIRDTQTRSPVAFAAFKLLVEEGVAKATEVLYVYELQLSPGVRGRGIGRLLMSLLERIASSAGVKMLMLTVFRANVKALEFYTRKCGFVVDECSPSWCFSVSDSPYEILSKCLRECEDVLLVHKCSHCTARFRYHESLVHHGCTVHGQPWPFPCGVDGCGLGVVRAKQKAQHMLMHRFPC